MKLKDKYFSVFHSGLLFAALLLLSFKLAAPTLADNILSSLLVILLPGFAYYLLLGIILKLFLKTSGKLIPLIAGGLMGVLMFVLTGSDLLISLFILLSGAVTFILSRHKALIWTAPGAVLLYIVIAQGSLKQKDPPQILIIGLDSMTPSIMDSLVKEGELPHIGALIQSGSWGSLQSERPMMSPILWTIIGSGYGRDKLGVDGFFNIGTQVQVPRLWDMLQQAGWTVGIFRWLITWPPQNVNGFMVPDFLARDEASYPAGYADINILRDIVKSRGGNTFLTYSQTCWRICQAGLRGSTILKLTYEACRLNFQLKDNKIAYRFSRLVEIEISADIFLNLMRKCQPRFAAFYDNGIDVMGHRMWKYHDPSGFSISQEESAKYGSYLCDMYRYSDDVVGRIMGELGDDINIVIVSDHGMQKAVGADKLITWIKTDNLFNDLGLRDRVYSQSPTIYQFVNPIGAEDAETFTHLISQNLRRFQFTDGSNPFSLRQSEAGDYYITADSYQSGSNGLLLDGEAVDIDRYIYEAFSLSGDHSLYGAVIFKGDNIEAGGVIEGATIHDITPTILHWMGLAVAENMDGRTLEQIFINPQQVRYIVQYDLPDYIGESGFKVIIDEKVKQKLRDMGYVK